MHQDESIHRLIHQVRARWRRLVFMQAAARGALAAAGVLAVALVASAFVLRIPWALGALGAAAIAGVSGAIAWAVWPFRRPPSDARVARFIEERDSSLEDRLVSAVDVARTGGGAGLAGPMMADAARRAGHVDPSGVVSGELLRRAGFQAAAAILLVAAVAFFGRHTARQSFDAASLALFPSRVTLEVTPGHARLKAGAPLTIEARLAGNRAPVVAQVLRADPSDEEQWQPAEMTASADGFSLSLESVNEPFKYRVVAGSLTSPVYDVDVVRPPRVTRVDLEYSFPRSTGLEPRLERDSGDIYAPSGTDVRIRVHTEGDAASGHLALAGKELALEASSSSEFVGGLTVSEDGSYRIALADRDGLSGGGDTEYFIRVIDDRLPEVRILRPARDRSVTPLEEVDIEAEAVDDFGIERLELVYSVRGGAEQVAPLGIAARATAVAGQHTLYLEDLDVRPGDFVSYYVRARDTARGRRAAEARSDIFFLEVKPFEQEFELAQSQAGGGGQNRELDDLVTAQKEIIVATWKLDRRAQAANARSEQDIKAVARAEAELKTRVEETASSFRESTMRDPRRIPGRGNTPPPGGLRAGQTLPEEDAMKAAALAMGKAAELLERLDTARAVAPELEALNHLLAAQADVKKRQVTRQQASGTGGANRASQDLSSLFDKELQRQQQTNYETPTTTQQPRNAAEETADRIKELARRQDELLRRQQELARERGQMTAEQLKRELERLTREQSELRQRAEDLARQMEDRRSPGQQPSGQSRGGRGSGSSAGNSSSEQMRQASEEMRNAASELRREDPGQASQRGARALERLQEAARQAQGAAPDEQRRALGDMQLEARQLADAQRQIADEASQAGREGRAGSRGAASGDTMRRLAGEQERLADRAQRLQDRMQGAPSGGPAAGEMARQRVPERMRESADQLRAGGEAREQRGDSRSAEAAARAQQDVARALDRAADALAAAGAPDDQESRRLSEQLARVQQTRDRIDDINREMERLNRQRASQQSGARGSEPGGQPAPTGSATPGVAAGDAPGSLPQQISQEMQRARELLETLRREGDAAAPQAGTGFTFEGQGMVLSAPGTEAFKQDFARWEQLRRQATTALDNAETALAGKLADRQSRDRLAAGVEDRPPADYQQQVDSYFKAIAGSKR